MACNTYVNISWVDGSAKTICISTRLSYVAIIEKKFSSIELQIIINA